MSKEKEQELENEQNEEMLNDDELDQVTGGSMKFAHVSKTSDISDSVKKRI